MIYLRCVRLGPLRRPTQFVVGSDNLASGARVALCAVFTVFVLSVAVVSALVTVFVRGVALLLYRMLLTPLCVRRLVSSHLMYHRPLLRGQLLHGRLKSCRLSPIVSTSAVLTSIPGIINSTTLSICFNRQICLSFALLRHGTTWTAPSSTASVLLDTPSLTDPVRVVYNLFFLTLYIVCFNCVRIK